MIFHNIYTIKIGQFAEMMETGNINMCKKVNIWLPKKIVEKGYIKLIKEFNGQSNAKEEKQRVNDGFDKLSVNYQSLWYECMFKMTQIWMQTYGDYKKEVWSDICDTYQLKYNKIPTEKDLHRAHKEHILLIEKASQVFQTPEENKKVDFEANVISLENVLAPITIRDKKLYIYYKYIKLAIKKVQPNG